MARTNPDAVRAVITVDAGVKLDPYIKTAAALIDWLVSKDTLNVLGTDLPLEIETHLAAHFYQAHRDRNYSSKSTGRASATFQGQTQMVLMSTDPGQTACLLDITGRLAALSAAAQGPRMALGLEWLGTAVESRDP